MIDFDKYDIGAAFYLTPGVEGSLAKGNISIGNVFTVKELTVKEMTDDSIDIEYEELPSGNPVLEYLYDKDDKLTPESALLKNKIEVAVRNAVITGLTESDPIKHDLDVRLSKMNRVRVENNPIKADVAIQVADAFVINGYKVVENNYGLFVRTPGKTIEIETGNKAFYELVHPSTIDFVDKVESVILSEYRDQTKFMDNMKETIPAEKEKEAPKRNSDPR